MTSNLMFQNKFGNSPWLIHLVFTISNSRVPAKHQATSEVKIKVIKFYKTVSVELETIGKIQKCQNSTNENHRRPEQDRIK